MSYGFSSETEIDSGTRTTVSVETKQITIFDVAKYIFEDWHKSYITQIELYKLLWFCQGWHYNVTQKPMFEEDFEAWDSGPVPRVLWNIFRGRLNLHKHDFDSMGIGNADKVSGVSKKVIDKVLNHYGYFSQEVLIYLSHKSDPWKKNNPKSDQLIPREEIKDYFCKL